jgi:hypothetical protein
VRKYRTWSVIRDGRIAVVAELNPWGELSLYRPRYMGPDGWELEPDWGYYPNCKPQDVFRILRRWAGGRIVSGIPRLPLEKE